MRLIAALLCATLAGTSGGHERARGEPQAAAVAPADRSPWLGLRVQLQQHEPLPARHGQPMPA